MIIFKESIRSERTYKIYKYYNDQFLRWAHKDYVSFSLLSSSEIQTLVEDYVIYLKRRLNPNSIAPRLAAINKLVEAIGKEYNKNKVKRLLPEKVKLAGGKSWSTQQIQKMLEYADTKRAKALVHFLAASGIRIGVLEDLKLKNIEEVQGGCKLIKAYAGTKWEYYTFLHHEASKALDEYIQERRSEGESVDDESFVFRQRYVLARQRPKSLTREAATGVIKRVLKRARIERTRDEKSVRYDIPIDTGFRKRYNSILKSNPNVSYAIAERLMDHRTNLESHYLHTPVDKLFEEYKKAIPELIIDDSERLKMRNQILEIEKSDLEKKNLEIEQLKIEQQKIIEDLKKVKARQERAEKYQKKII